MMFFFAKNAKALLIHYIYITNVFSTFLNFLFVILAVYIATATLRVISSLPPLPTSRST